MPRCTSRKCSTEGQEVGHRIRYLGGKGQRNHNLQNNTTKNHTVFNPGLDLTFASACWLVWMCAWNVQLRVQLKVQSHFSSSAIPYTAESRAEFQNTSSNGCTSKGPLQRVARWVQKNRVRKNKQSTTKKRRSWLLFLTGSTSPSQSILYSSS